LLSSEPPSDIWPAPEAKAKKVERHRRVDVNSNWVIPRSRLRSAAIFATAILLLALVLLAHTFIERQKNRVSKTAHVGQSAL
jgi:hypothetical protein